MNDSMKMLTPAFIRPYLVVAIAQLTGHREGVVVPVDKVFKHLYGSMGRFLPSNYTSEWAAKFRVRVSRCRYHYTNHTKPRFQSPSYGVWSLTSLGLQESVKESSNVLEAFQVTPSTKVNTGWIDGALKACLGLPQRKVKGKPRQHSLERLRGAILQVMGEWTGFCPLVPLKISFLKEKVIALLGGSHQDTSKLKRRIYTAGRTLVKKKCVTPLGRGLWSLSVKGLNTSVEVAQNREQLTEMVSSSSMSVEDSGDLTPPVTLPEVIEAPVDVSQEPKTKFKIRRPKKKTKALTQKTEPKGNETAQYFAKHFKGGAKSKLYKSCVQYLRRYLPNSEAYGFLEDHIQQFVVVSIRRNSLQKHLLEGTVTHKKIASYCVNSARSDLRGMATNPVSRSLYHAKTHKEVKSSLKEADSLEPEQFTHLNEINQDTDGAIAVPEAITTLSEVSLDFSRLWSSIEDLIRKKQPQIAESQMALLALKAQGLTGTESAEIMGLKPIQARRRMREVQALCANHMPLEIKEGLGLV